MKRLFLGIMMLMMMSFAYANDIYVTQSGATLDLDITQDGQDNKVGNSTTSSSVIGATSTIDIDQVGIKAIKHPIVVKDKSSGSQHTIANFDMYVQLPHNFKGTHMSRFVEILNENDKEI